MIDYAQELESFLAWCHPRLEEVFGADGAREVWLQGEAYRYFRYHRPTGPLYLYTNAHNKNDLAFFAPTEHDQPDAVVEIKLYGLNFLQKNLTGYHSLAPYRELSEGGRFCFQPEHAERCHPQEGSILKDYKKLLSQAGRRYLLLVLNTANEPNAFGKAIQRVDFGGPGRTVLQNRNFAATVWEIA